ncbi:MAG: regulatory protein [Flavobacteriales bacterium]|jgi:regulatory protein
MEEKKHIYDINEARIRVHNYCAYQERCQKEVREKLISWGMIELVVDTLMVELIQGNFLNEERFSIAFARGKFRFKHWGKYKIKQELWRRDISEYCINKAMLEIDGLGYKDEIKLLADKYLSKQKESHPYLLKRKTANYLIRKGFESALVWDVLNTED